MTVSMEFTIPEISERCDICCRDESSVSGLCLCCYEAVMRAVYGTNGVDLILAASAATA